MNRQGQTRSGKQVVNDRPQRPSVESPCPKSGRSVFRDPNQGHEESWHEDRAYGRACRPRRLRSRRWLHKRYLTLCTTGKKNGKPAGIVIPSVLVLRGVLPNSPPHHTRVSSRRPRAFRSRETGHGFVGVAGMIGMLGHVAVLVPAGVV